MRPADRVAIGFGHQIEFPDDVAGLGVERVHAPLSALFVAPGIADEDETVPGDRRSGHGLALLWIGDRGLPAPPAGLEIIGQHSSVLGTAKQHAVQVGGTPVQRQNVRREVLVRAPILTAGRRVDRENIVFGRADERTLDHDQTGLET